MPASHTLKWNGKKIYREMVEASQDGVNETMSECAKRAKSHHPNWRNRTGAAEGSVQIVEYAKQIFASVVGAWGSKGINYALFLERYHGPWLRAAADVEYPKLRDRVAASWRRRGGTEL